MSSICRYFGTAAFFLIVSAVPHSNVCASDVQIKTADGETLTGEFLGTEDGIIKVRSKYGIVSIPSKDVITMVKAPDAPVTADAKKKEGEADAAPLTFPEPREINLKSFLAARAPEPPEAGKQERQEIFRHIRNFRESSDRSRIKSIGVLQSYGAMAYPFIASEYAAPDELDDKIQILSAIAVSNRPYTAGIFAETHTLALKEFYRVSDLPPPPPPDYITKRDREFSDSFPSNVKAAAQRVLALEAYASVAQGPFNTLLLLQVYKQRYSGEKDALLKNTPRDRGLLAAAAGDVSLSKTEWTGGDRVTLSEQALPLLFVESEDLKSIARELLKKILPANHPKFEAAQDEWVNWWIKNKDKIEKK